jgi:hypothetical protein
VSALHKPILRALHQSTLYRITVNIAELLCALLLAPLFYFQSLDPELEIVMACLPEGLRLNIPALRFAIERATRGESALTLRLECRMCRGPSTT